MAAQADWDTYVFADNKNEAFQLHCLRHYLYFSVPSIVFPIVPDDAEVAVAILKILMKVNWAEDGFSLVWFSWYISL